MKTRTRGTVNEATFNQVKELQKMGASAARAGRFVNLSQATVSRMYNNPNFAEYRAYVSSISNTKKIQLPTVTPTRTHVISNRKAAPEADLQELTNAIIRLAVSIEESNAKKKSIW